MTSIRGHSDYELRLKGFCQFVIGLTAYSHSGNSFLHVNLLCFHEKFSYSWKAGTILDCYICFKITFFYMVFTIFSKFAFFSLFSLKKPCENVKTSEFCLRNQRNIDGRATRYVKEKFCLFLIKTTPRGPTINLNS